MIRGRAPAGGDVTSRAAISGGHFNPAVTLGLWTARRCANKHVLPYVVAQVVGAIVAAGVLWIIASGKPEWVPAGFAANGYGDLSPGKYGLISCLITDLVMTFFFLIIIVGTTSKGAAAGFAGIPIGLALTLILHSSTAALMQINSQVLRRRACFRITCEFPSTEERPPGSLARWARL